MGVSAGKSVHAGDRADADRRADRHQAPPRAATRKQAAGRLTGPRAAVLAGLALFAGAAASAAETIRIATWDVELSRDGPGLLLRDILKGEDAQVAAAVATLAGVAPDILLLTGFDWDLEGRALAAFATRLDAAGLELPFRYAPRPNAGWPTGADLDGDGRAGTARDARGYGRFSGQGGMALLSRLPIDKGAARDFTALRWADLPGAALEPAERARLPGGPWLSSTGHWDVPVLLPGGGRLQLLAFAAGPPVFDGPEDFNGRRNADEVGFWSLYLDGRLPQPPPEAAVVVVGLANLDPADGEGRRAAIRALLAHPRLQDPAPRSDGGASAAREQGGVNATQRGDPALDTADFSDADGPGNLRLSYILPDRRLQVTAAGVVWPGAGERLAGGGDAGLFRHRLVWVDLVVNGAP